VYKQQITNNKFQTNSNSQIKIFDLEERTKKFAENCRDLTLNVSKSIPNIEYSKQLIRSSASPAANYIEANEALSKKDFVMRVKICRKEAKESKLWLELLIIENPKQDQTRVDLIKEAIELVKIFSSIIAKSV